MATLTLRLVGALLLAGSALHAQEGEGPLQVLRHTPSDTASPGNLITVSFDRPVAGRLDASVDPGRIFRIAPAVSGKVTWRDPVTIRFTPDEPLAPGLTFTV